MGRIFGVGASVKEVGDAVGGVAEVFVGNQSDRDANAHGRYVESVEQFGAEFAAAGQGWFHGVMDGLNRLPRPLLVMGTLSLFVYAMAEPVGFSERMEGLALVPDPLWWLLGAIVSFYFGARELHYQRARESLRGRAIRRIVGSRGEQKAAPEAQSGQAADRAGADDAEPDAATVVAKSTPATLVSRTPVAVKASDPNFNAALEEWRSGRG